jgi:hypothetical protein
MVPGVDATAVDKNGGLIEMRKVRRAACFPQKLMGILAHFHDGACLLLAEPPQSLMPVAVHLMTMVVAGLLRASRQGPAEAALRVSIFVRCCC